MKERSLGSALFNSIIEAVGKPACVSVGRHQRWDPDMLSAQQRFWPDPQPLVERLGREFFRHVPESPGVYLMRGLGDAVLYVGKAKNL